MSDVVDTVRVLVVDDQPWVRVGLQELLGLEPGLEVAAALEGGEAALAWLAENRVDVALVDVRMPGMDGVELARRLKERGDPVRCVLLTTFEEEDLMVAGLEAGVDGYLLKDVSVEMLSRAIRRVARGERFIQPRVAETLAAALRRRPEPAPPPEALTPREREVLALLARSLSNKEIARALELTPGTVKVHVSSILAKLGARDRREAVARAVEAGALDD